jgi:sortase A
VTRWVDRSFLLVGVVCLGLSAWTWLESDVYQFVQGRRLDALIGSGFTSHRRRHPDARMARAGDDLQNPIGRIDISRVGISAIVVEGVDPRTLRHAVGHMPSTALPGDPGNVVLAGHRDTFFRRLKDVRPGDRVTLTTPEGVFDYDIDSTDVVAPDRVEILAPSGSPSLTLITCYPFNYVGPAPDRFIVHARQEG